MNMNEIILLGDDELMGNCNVGNLSQMVQEAHVGQSKSEEQGHENME